MKNINYFTELDYQRMEQEYPLGEEYIKLIKNISRDELYALQEKRFLSLISKGWKIPFYKRHWESSGLASGDIRRLEDSIKIPTYSKSDLMRSIEKFSYS